jgi:hypothetical protein
MRLGGTDAEVIMSSGLQPYGQDKRVRELTREIAEDVAVLLRDQLERWAHQLA